MSPRRGRDDDAYHEAPVDDAVHPHRESPIADRPHPDERNVLLEGLEGIAVIALTSLLFSLVTAGLALVVAAIF